MRLLLIRHGQTPANVDGVLDTLVPGPGLTALGREQAARLPEALGDRGVGAVFVSDMVRTHETAAPLAEALGLEPVELPGLHEIDAGDLEGKRDRASVLEYMGTVSAWLEGDRDRRMPGGPDGHAFFARFDAAVSTIAAGGADTAAAFSHGAAIRSWAGGTATNLADHALARHTLENTGIVELDGDPASGWTVVRWEGQPVGGDEVADRSAPDPTGEAFTPPDGATPASR
ncbi:histidine phosphatase family protein [Curtobacterium sp. MCBD17_034]|uniref:histidine phosphatase family protein n=1 Tax=unclassified Curtobacterium TaxID=257496 RepID=UPI000DA8A79C|nr:MULTISPECIES: histidine phosphatase family protein [unclassified Curtobacterium]PZE78474.1 histidine phosphatase family protein [Curtobacterium sp. MCBD17_019]PZF57141.1 histidine phosphatase family protein [Curtobacterium sp. MCBD17_034]PZM33509.1 histidine phosphatase family protein [Curtobacterium sp. MCBD17_031]